MPASPSWNTSARAIALAHYAARGEMLPASAQRHSWGYVEPFEVARRIATDIDPSARLDYIPRKERTACEWIDERILHDPARGDLMWVGGAKQPRSGWDLLKTRLFVCRQCVSSDIHDVVLKSKERWQHRNGVHWTNEGRWYIDSDTVERWVEQEKEKWKQAVGESWVRCLRKEDWKKAYDMVLGGLLDRGTFMEWLDQTAWNRGMEDIESSCGDMEEGEVEEEPVEPVVEETPAHELDMGWERLEAFLERGLGEDF